MLCSIIIFLFFTLTQCELLQLPDESLSIPEECTDSTLSSTNYEDLKGKFPSWHSNWLIFSILELELTISETVSTEGTAFIENEEIVLINSDITIEKLRGVAW